MENHSESKQPIIKGIHISRMNAVMILASAILYVLLTVTAARVAATLLDTYLTMDDFFVCTQNELLLMEASDYLTEQSRLYTITGDRAYIDGYFTEINTTRRRENAIQNLLDTEQSEEISTYWQSAQAGSDLLSEREIYAMRLAAEARGSDISVLPLAVRDVRLSSEDAALSPEEQLDKAQDMLYGTAYYAAKQQVKNDIDSASKSLNSAINVTLEDGYLNFRGAMDLHQTLIILHAVCTVISFTFTILLVVLPMTRYVKHIKAGEKLRVVGAYECKCLAQTCNTMFARNAAHENRLRHQAEHDALTGLFNRGAFDSLRQKLSEEKAALGLLIVDVDKFKQVNDGHGHEMGDRVLQRVAELLTENFQEIGSPCRIGGDEFSVILTGAAQVQTVQSKIEAINQTLTHPKNGLPVVSLSVGGAFSDEGFTDTLYKQADAALYVVKEHGRCGCRFYTEEMAGIEV